MTLASALTCAFLVTTLAPMPAQADTETLTVAAAADLKFALDAATREFRKSHPHTEVKVSYGSSGGFFAQISNGAPFDLFLSADIAYPRKLADAGHADLASLFVYAEGQIAAWVPKSSKLDLDKKGVRALLDARTVAIANPRHAPYGRATEEALTKLGLHEKLKPKLVLGENVAQAAHFAESGAADAGIVALALALSPPMTSKGRHWVFPKDSYTLLEQGGIILKAGKAPKAARAFAHFLTETPGRTVLREFGFKLPGE